LKEEKRHGKSISVKRFPNSSTDDLPLKDQTKRPEEEKQNFFRTAEGGEVKRYLQ